MQNADKAAGKSKTITEGEGEAAEGAANLELAVEQQQEEQLLAESQTKIKTRSRFSAAFRSLSKPKKPKDSKDTNQELSGEELPVHSGASLSELSEKKKSLTRRLLLGGLKKSKVRPHSLATSDDISVLSTSSREQGSEEVEQQQQQSPSSSSNTTLKITISGKKVETKKSKNKAASETDYLTPTTKATTTKTTLTKEIGSSSSRSTKLIVAKVSKEPANVAEQKKKKKRIQQATPATEEKIVITESTRDTPPRERAPAKPSRAAAATSIQSASSSGAVRKSSKQRELMQQQQQRGHRSNSSNSRLNSATTATTNSSTLQQPPTYSPPPPPPPPPPLPASPSPSSTIVLVSLSEVEEHNDAVSLAEEPSAAPIVRFAVGSAVRGPAADTAYEAALAAAASQQPSSSEEPSDSSLRRRHIFAQQQLQLSDHDSIEGRRETLRYQSVASEYSNADSVSDDDGEEELQEQDKEQKQGGQPQPDKPMPAFGDLTMDQEMEPTIMSPSSEKREHLYKILVIGELGTGKTSFIKRYVHQFFSQNYRATIGVDFALKVLHWDANTIVRLQLWDIAGQERFGNMTRVYYKEAVGAFIVFDVTRSGTFDCVSKWKEDLDSKVQLPDGSPIPCILLANKCDQEKQGIVTQPERMDEYVRENGFAGWFETSAKENINIDEAARALVNKILINDKLITADASDEEKFNLSNPADAATDGKNKCSC